MSTWTPGTAICKNCGLTQCAHNEYGDCPTYRSAPHTDEPAQPAKTCIHGFLPWNPAVDKGDPLCDCHLAPAQPAQPCTCCNDLAQLAAEFADATRYENAGDHTRSQAARERYMDIIVKHITDKHNQPAQPAPTEQDVAAEAWHKGYVVSGPSEQDWKSLSVCAIAAENPSVAEYCAHWEKRADAAEAQVQVLRDALQPLVWRLRSQFPNDPYCVLCGAGQNWANKHGHEPTCALAATEGKDVKK